MNINGSIRGYNYEVKPVTASEVEGISLRPHDEKELLFDLTDCDCRTGLADSVEMSEEAFVVEMNGKPEAYFGVTENGSIWWLSTWLPLEVGPEVFQTLTDLFLDMWLEKYGVLWNSTLTENTVSIAWLESKGFTLEPNGEWTKFWKEYDDCLD